MEPTASDAQPLLAPFASCRLFDDLRADLRAEIHRSLSLVRLAPGECLFRQREPTDALYVIASGRLLVSSAGEDGSERPVGELRPGDPVGEMQFLTGGRRTATVTAAEAAEVVKFPRDCFEALALKSPEVKDEVAELIRRRLQHYRLGVMIPLFFRSAGETLLAEIERSLHWSHLSRGEYLFHQGDRDATLYILMSGRLQVTVEGRDGAVRVVGEVRPGESVGEMALLSGEERSADVRALRDSDLVSLSKEACEEIAIRHPRAITDLTRIIIQRLKTNIRSERAIGKGGTLALVPLQADFPIHELAGKLAAALVRGGSSVVHLTSAKLDDDLGTEGISQLAEADASAIRVHVALEGYEAHHDYVLFEADPTATEWSKRCIRDADRILLVTDAARDPEPGPYERELMQVRGADDTDKTLLLVHGEDVKLPRGTERWLDPRHVSQWFHMRRGAEADLERIVRCMTGRAFGLALSGGGARGFAHIGVSQALRENRIDVDVIGGTSMGSVIAAGQAMGIDPLSFAAVLKERFAKYRPFQEVTLPIYSIIASRRLDRLLQDYLGDTRIEDLWVPYFCVSTNLTKAEVVIHRRGSLWRAIRASIAIPGVILPVVAGDSLLVDGGIVNNLPADIMRDLFGGRILAVDVSPEQDVEVGEGNSRFPSPWASLIPRFFRRRAGGKMPGISQILFRTTVLGSISSLDKVKREADWYLKVPLDRVGILDFDDLDTIVAGGYACATEMLPKLGVTTGAAAMVS